MQTPMKREEKDVEQTSDKQSQPDLPTVAETPVDQTMEERLARVGAKIDDLIQKAAEAQKHVQEKAEELKSKGETTCRKSGEALGELKLALDSAWDELNHAWHDIQKGTERAVEKFRSE